MPKYLEIETSDRFDDTIDTVFDALDRGAIVGHASSVGRSDLEQVLIDLDGYCWFDLTGQEQDQALVDLKFRTAHLIQKLKEERRARTT